MIMNEFAFFLSRTSNNGDDILGKKKRTSPHNSYSTTYYPIILMVDSVDEKSILLCLNWTRLLHTHTHTKRTHALADSCGMNEKEERNLPSFG
jgi:hypothetical protein